MLSFYVAFLSISKWSTCNKFKNKLSTIQPQSMGKFKNIQVNLNFAGSSKKKSVLNHCCIFEVVYVMNLIINNGNNLHFSISLLVHIQFLSYFASIDFI